MLTLKKVKLLKSRFWSATHAILDTFWYQIRSYFHENSSFFSSKRCYSIKLIKIFNIRCKIWVNRFKFWSKIWKYKTYRRGLSSKIYKWNYRACIKGKCSYIMMSKIIRILFMLTCLMIIILWILSLLRVFMPKKWKDKWGRKK